MLEANFPAIESTELFADSSSRAARDPYSIHGAPILAYLDRVLTPGRFAHVVFPVKMRSWVWRAVLQSQGIPIKLDDLTVASTRRKELLQVAAAGFGLVIGTRVDLDCEEEFFREIGYARAGVSRVGAEGAHDPLRPAWNRASLRAAVEMALTDPCRTACIFGHDGDPVYLLRLIDASAGPDRLTAQIAG